jgi:hypothetical protein
MLRVVQKPNFPAARLLAAALLAGACGAAGAQSSSIRYSLTAPPLLADAEPAARPAPVGLGSMRLAGGANDGSGNGLSLEAGENWFARAGIGRTLDADVLSVGGGYRFSGGDSLTMSVMRQFGQERLGLAVRYDWRQAYLRLSYEQPLRSPGASDRLRFSAGVKF